MHSKLHFLFAILHFLLYNIPGDDYEREFTGHASKGKNGNINLPYERSYECAGINQSKMKDAVSFIEENGKIFLEKLGYKYENGVYRIIKPNEDRIALFCHAAFSRAWLSVLLHVPLHIMWSSFQYTHTGVTVLEFKNNENGFTAPTCLCFSDVSHLYAANLDLIIDNKIEI